MFLLLLIHTARNIIDCGPPSRPLNGGNSYTSTTFQSQVTYTCASEYYLQGPSTRWCQSDGTWSGYDPQCNRGMYMSCQIVCCMTAV